MANLTGLPSGSPVDSTARSTDQKLPLGTIMHDKDGNEYTYVKAGATIAQYDAVRFQGSTLGFDDIRPTSAALQVLVGVAQAAFASADYGFILTRGVVTCKVINSTAAGSALVTGATAGTLALSTASDLAGTKAAVALVTGVATGSAIAIGV